MSNNKINFAALRRVSTEKQEKEGESLRTQKNEIEISVEQLGGKIIGWYGSQEHATPGYEKKEIDRLISDAKKKRFDAVIVSDADRWSRDNQKSRQGLDIFKEFGIRFFIGTSEQDLSNEDHRLFLGISAEIGQFFAVKQKRKSITNRIARAKRGLPTAGKLPYGRTYDKENGWGIDKEKKSIIEEIARRYLAGEKMPELATEYGMNHSNLHKILTKRSGDEWEQEFHSKELNIHDKVITKIPRLLPQKTIDAILKKSAANKTYSHGQRKHYYLLSRMIFCEHCGYAMFGQINSEGKKYYRHISATKRDKKCTNPKTWIPAEEIEDLVMRHLFECFGNPSAVQKAIEEATPNLEKIREYQNRISAIDSTLNKIQAARDRILKLVVNLAIGEKESERQLKDQNKRQEKLQVEKERLLDYLESQPDFDKIKTVSKNVSTAFLTRKRLIKEKANINFDKMTWEEKRHLVEMVFSGKTPDGRRMGVFIEWPEKGNWRFSIRGHLIDQENLIRNKAPKDFEQSAGYKQDSLVNKYACY